MIWSRYNTLFESERFGFFLYNALSNTLLELDRTHFSHCDAMKKEGLCTGKHIDEAFLTFLADHRMLVGEGEENRMLTARHYQRNTHCFDSSRLGLTICPTLQCNFRCPYCFEQNQEQSAVMTETRMTQLLNFIRSYRDIRHLSIAWYGGEPLLAFKEICEITQKIKALDLDFEGAGMVTNGYLLDRAKISKLNELNITSLQVTLDGERKLHDRRRMLAGGGATYQRIMENLTELMESSYGGTCTVRVNIDRENIRHYFELRNTLMERFKGKKFSVYPGHISDDHHTAGKRGCMLDLCEWTQFNLDLYYRHGIIPTEGFFPPDNAESICVGTKHHCFVVGPEGELYKCWEDAGRAEMVVGHLDQAEPVTNPVLRAEYCTGTDPYCDIECRECSALPICGGGCVNRRLRAKQFGQTGLEFCSPYKENLIALLEGYIDLVRSRELCTEMLSGKQQKQFDHGCRDISPKRELVVETPDTGS